MGVGSKFLPAIVRASRFPTKYAKFPDKKRFLVSPRKSTRLSKRLLLCQVGRGERPRPLAPSARIRTVTPCFGVGKTATAIVHVRNHEGHSRQCPHAHSVSGSFGQEEVKGGWMSKVPVSTGLSRPIYDCLLSHADDRDAAVFSSRLTASTSGRSRVPCVA